MKMHMRDIRIRFKDLTGLERYYKDAYTRYQEETSGCHEIGTLI